MQQITMVLKNSALVAITYGENKTLKVTNNTDKTIKNNSVELIGESEKEIVNMEESDSDVMAGEIKEFALTGDLRS